MNAESRGNNVTTDTVPNVKVADAFAYVTSNKVIANIIIKSPNGEQKRILMRTNAAAT